MRLLSITGLAFGMVWVCAAAAAPVTGGRTSALGGPVAARGALTHPLGGVTTPSRLGTVTATSRPGGLTTPRPRINHTPGYAYAWYVPAYYGYGAGADYNASISPVAQQDSAQQQPVIINQYFGAQSDPAQGLQHEAPQQDASAPPPAPGDPIGTPENYYLIAYKNHEVFSALAYWVEDKTLHYVTTQNTHNQASLDFIDLDLTKSLNQSRDVPFSLPGR